MAATYLPRTLERFVQAASQQFPVLLLTGARQVGKTTLLRVASGGDRRYVTLDDPQVLALARRDPALFFQRFPAPLLIDEIQYAPELLPHVKMAVDANRTPGAFWLTGSQQFHMMKGVSESLAGRVGVVQLLGLSLAERLGRGAESPSFLPTPEQNARRGATAPTLTLAEVYATIWRGAFPALVADSGVERDLFYGSYVTTYVQRDVRDLARVGDEMAFLRFLRATAARSAQLLNLSELARDADVTPNTAKAWLSILQASGLVWLLEPYHANVTKRLVKAPKLYFLDTGLAAYLTEWTSPETLEAGAMAGSLFETWVVGELLKSYLHNGRRPPFYYYRDRDQREIDLLIVQDGVVYPLECKKTASPRVDDVRHFAALERLGVPVGPGGVLCLAQQVLPLTRDTWVLPVSTLAGQADQARHAAS